MRCALTRFGQARLGPGKSSSSPVRSTRALHLSDDTQLATRTVMHDIAPAETRVDGRLRGHGAREWIVKLPSPRPCSGIRRGKPLCDAAVLSHDPSASRSRISAVVAWQTIPRKQSGSSNLPAARLQLNGETTHLRCRRCTVSLQMSNNAIRLPCDSRRIVCS